MSVLIGTAGWSLPALEQAHFSQVGSHLERYSQTFPVAEINSTFRRSHRASTYLRWRDSVPSEFRFSVKIPKTITHEKRLKDSGPAFRTFMTEVNGLGEKLGCLLVQLPPSLTLKVGTVRKFFTLVRSITDGPVVCEPRHATWFEVVADELLSQYQISRVAADPAVVPEAAKPGGCQRLIYYRLHGSPRPYYSEYSGSYLSALSQRFAADAKRLTVWCIFDNTTLGAATSNARNLLQLCRVQDATGIGSRKNQSNL